MALEYGHPHCRPCGRGCQAGGGQTHHPL